MTLLEGVVSQMRQRVEELAPAVAEHNDIVAALEKLNGSASTPNPPLPKPAGRRKRGRGRPKGSGGTQARLLEVIRTSPGLKIQEIAARLGMKPNYLYRALPQLAAEGQVFQAANKTWHPTTKESA